MASTDTFPYTDDTQFCECCERELHSDRIVWLELSFVTSQYASLDNDTIPADESQGCFPFGKACAAKVLRQQDRIRPDGTSIRKGYTEASEPWAVVE